MRVTLSLRRDRSDAAVIASSLTRPEEFGAIFDRHFAAVHAYLARRIGEAAADDLASATFEVAFTRRQTFRHSADSARPWLFGIATNLLRNEWRAERRALAVAGRLHGTADEQASPVNDPSGLAGAVSLRDLLSELDPDQRDVLLLYVWEGFSYEEIAVSLGLPVGTVRSRLARGRERLRGSLRHNDPGGAALTHDPQEISE